MLGKLDWSAIPFDEPIPMISSSIIARYPGFHFFTNEAGGNMMMFMNLVWAWGHPEVYILILPAFGIFSEVISTFSGKPLFGYRSMVAATMVICVLSFMVWLHHFFTMGAGADVNAFFGITTMIIAVPTGVKVFNWLFTMYGGRMRFETPMMRAVAFMITFVIGGVLFGAFAGYTYWWPKAFGFRLDPFWGKVSFWTWVVGFWLAFMPLYVLGLMGMTRRMQHYDVPEWRPWLLVAALGAAVILCGIVLRVAQLVYSIRNHELPRDTTGDPWDGRTLEWITASPPPSFNFATLPNVTGEEAHWGMKQAAIQNSRLSEQPRYAVIDMPRNSPTGIVCAFFATVTGFALIWHIWWMAILGLVGAFATFVVFAWRDHDEYEIPPEDVARQDEERRRQKARYLIEKGSPA